MLKNLKLITVLVLVALVTSPALAQTLHEPPLLGDVVIIQCGLNTEAGTDKVLFAISSTGKSIDGLKVPKFKGSNCVDIIADLIGGSGFALTVPPDPSDVRMYHFIR